MKRKLLFAIVALLCSIGAWAVTGSQITATMTDVFLYNVESAQYLTAGDWWGTHATIGTAGMDLDLTKISDGVYTIQTRQNNGGDTSKGRYMSGVWMDSNSSMNFTFSEVDTENHYYTISYDDSGTKYLYSTGSTVEGGTSVDGSAYYWQVVTRADFISSLSGATNANPKDATGAIYNAGFFVFDYATVKNAVFPDTRSWQGTKLTDTWGYRNNESGTSSSNYCAEQFGKEFDNYQALTGMPNGKYVVKNQGFYKGDNVGYLYANDQQVALTKITDNPTAPKGYDGNALQKASYAFGKADLYHNTTPAVIVTDGTLRIGTKATNNTDTWYCFDNFTLEYYGNAVEVYSPTAFDGDETVTASAWYAFTVASAGVYKITSTAAATISYTQDASDDADEVSTTMNIAASGLVLKNFSAGTFYFKSSAASTITITAAPDGTDITSMMSNAAVASTTGWTAGATASGQQYTNAPDNNYLDNNSGEKNMYQDVNLPAGYYLMKCATRASTTANANVYVYSYETSANVGIANNHKEGNSGNLLENGWAWTYVPFTLAADCKVGIGFYSNCSSTWAGADDFHLTYYTTELAMKQGHLAQVVADANAWGAKVTTTNALETALAASAPSCSTVSECNTAISNLTTLVANARDSEVAYADFVRVKAGADAMVLVANTDATATSTLTIASSAQSTAAEAATTLADVNTALSTLRTAIKTFISSAEPSNDGEYFDITCLIENPSFENNNATGWSGDTPGFQSYGNAEFFNKNFDFYQNLTGLANGSYQLTVQAFCRPGDNGTTSSGAYYDYTQGVNNITAELYVNSDASTIGNIYSYKDNTAEAKVAGNDFHCTISSDNYWVPNNMKGAGLYFEDDAYVTNVAALVTDGNLKIGFREESKKTNQWVIFDNFHLYYYGTSKMIYYKQYLPQLREEVSADLSNGAYANVLTSSEDEALDAALAAEPASETEEAYKAVIDGILAAQTAFRAAKTSYDAMVSAKAYSALTKVSANIGTGVFQYNETTNNSLFSAYETAKSAVDSYAFTTSSTAADAQALVDALDDAIEDYNNQPLNAPAAGNHYYVKVATSGHVKEGKAIVLDRAAEYPVYQNSYISNNTGFTLNASAEPAEYLAQVVTFTQVSGNVYNISMEREEGTVYLTYGSLNDSKVNWKEAQIQATTESSKKGEFKIVATATPNVFNIVNTTATGGTIACQSNGNIYTEAGNADFTLAEASQASVTVAAKSGKYGTVIFPFTPDVSSGFDGITFYSCESVNSTTNKVQLDEVTTPAANTPYLIKNDGGSNFSKILTGWGTAASAYSNGNGLLTGVYTDATIAADANNYVLQTPTDGVNEGNQAFYLVQDEDFTATAYKCYLTYSSGGSVKSFGFEFNGETSINAIDNGQWKMDNAAIYNLAGQKVKKATKGIYIVNGKKVVKK